MRLPTLPNVLLEMEEFGGDEEEEDEDLFPIFEEGEYVL